MLAAALLVIELAIIWIAGVLALTSLIAALIGITFVLAAWWGGPRAAETALGPRQRLCLWGGEIAAAWSLFLCAMPLERWLMRRDRPRQAAAVAGDSARSAPPATMADAPPVLLIHGYVNNAGALWRLWRALCRKGLGVYTLNLEPVWANIDDYAPRIAARIDAVCAASAATEVTLVCHSMGGLAARAYLRQCALAGTAPRVARVITLGSPHQGTHLAWLERSANGRQMRHDSTWLAALAAHERGAWACPLVSIYSLDDNVVVPALSARLDGARNIELTGIGHISLPLARRVIDLVTAEVSAGVAGVRPGAAR